MYLWVDFLSVLLRSHLQACTDFTVDDLGLHCYSPIHLIFPRSSQAECFFIFCLVSLIQCCLHLSLCIDLLIFVPKTCSLLLPLNWSSFCFQFGTTYALKSLVTLPTFVIKYVVPSLCLQYCFFSNDANWIWKETIGRGETRCKNFAFRFLKWLFL